MIRIFLILSILLSLSGFLGSEETIEHQSEEKPMVTLIALGADNCMPCKMMRPIYEEIRQEYDGRVKVTFYDVWKDPSYGHFYRVRVIPTQIFYDADGKEFRRNEGYLPKEQIVKLLEEKLKQPVPEN